MLPPADDLAERRPIWDALQMLWMDTDPESELEGIARSCATSKYSLDELEAIFWNEIRPAVKFNTRMNHLPEWAGFDLEWLTGRVLEKQRFGKPLPWRWLRGADQLWWNRLAERLRVLRAPRL